MTLFGSGFRKRCAYLDDVARRNWGTRLLGRRLQRRWAGGSEFVGHSDYTSGDDFRYVDWHLCARIDELLTRQYRGSEDRSVHLLVDSSVSMQLGQPVKFDVARRLAGALGYLALSGLDRVGIVGFADRVTAELPPVRGRAHLAGLLRFLDELPRGTAPVRLNQVIDDFTRHRPHRGLAVLISDLFDPLGFEAAVDRLLRSGFQPYLLQVVDDREAEPDFAGSVRLVDVVRGQSRCICLEEVDLVNYRRVFDEFCAACRSYCGRRGIGIMQTRTGTPWEQVVLRMIRTATKRMAAG
jgi:uncharacterized protein (DUF58 family)